MRAAVLQGLGEVPRCGEFAEPVAGDGEVVVKVRAAALKPVDKQIASGAHYASTRHLPCVCGTDGVGLVEGRRVFFGGARAPYGAMAERAVVRSAFLFPVPEGIEDEVAAALANPGVSAWLSLAFRAKLAPGERVLILGATGVTGKLAVRTAKILGAGRVVAAGRNAETLRALREQGADATISLEMPPEELRETLVQEAKRPGSQVVIDYVWGRPAEAVLQALGNEEFAAIASETRYVQVGESAGATITLPAAVLRSAAVTIMGTAGIPPREMLSEALRRVLEHGARGELRVEAERMPLAEVEGAWRREPSGRRIVLVP